MRRVLSLWFPTLSTDRICRSRPDWRGEPLVTVGQGRGGLTIAAANGPARAAGLVPDMPLADARALVPGLRATTADAAEDSRILVWLADWCGRYTPWAVTDSEDGLFLDITGCAHLFGGEAALLGDLLRRLRSFGFVGRAAVADSPGAAWAAARHGGTRTQPIAILPPGGTRAALAVLPVTGLRLPSETAESLSRLGLRHIGDLYGLPRAPLAARFGEVLIRRLDQALGSVFEPIAARNPVAPQRARLTFAEPILRIEDIAAALRRLLDELCRRLEREALGARRLELTLYRVDGGTARAAIGTSRPVRDPDHLARLFEEHLSRLDPGFGVETATLAALATAPLVPGQLALSGKGRPPDGAAALGVLVDRLCNRLGAASVLRLAPRESHVPERAVTVVPALAPTTGRSWRTDRPRPVRLLPRPEPIEAVAEIPDSPPAQFVWRKVAHPVRRAEGPERIALEWWRDADADAVVRDYYRVEDQVGQRFWVYREGLYGSGTTRWFLHGFFA